MKRTKNRLSIKTAIAATTFVLTACGDGVEYKYDEVTGLCKNEKGEVGVNANKLVECGFIENAGTKFSKKKKKEKSLMGLTVKNSNLSDVNFEGANLKGARFEQTRSSTTPLDLNFANLTRTNLENTEFSIHPDYMTTQISSSKINEHTLFPIGFDYSIDTLTSGFNLEYSYKGKFDAASLSGLSLASGTKPAAKDLITVDMKRLVSTGLIDIERAEKKELFSDVGTTSSERNALNYIVKRVPNWWVDNSMSGGVLAYNQSSYMFMKTMYQDLFTDAQFITDKFAITLKNKDRVYDEDLVANLKNDIAAVSPSYKFNSTDYKMTTPHSGIATFAMGYVGQQVSQIERLATLVHESRHSDVTIDKSTVNTYNDLVNQYRTLKKGTTKLGKAIIKSDAQSFADSVDSFFDTNAHVKKKDYKSIYGQYSKSEVNPDWGYRHTYCPYDVMGGAEGACDDSEEGAYAVGRHFLVAVANTCTTCTEFEKEMARMGAIDAKSRYVGDRKTTYVRKRPAPADASRNEIVLDLAD